MADNFRGKLGPGSCPSYVRSLTRGFWINQSRWALGSSPEAGNPILLFGLSPGEGLSQGCPEQELPDGPKAASETHVLAHSEEGAAGMNAQGLSLCHLAWRGWQSPALCSASWWLSCLSSGLAGKKNAFLGWVICQDKWVGSSFLHSQRLGQCQAYSRSREKSGAMCKPIWAWETAGVTLHPGMTVLGPGHHSSLGSHVAWCWESLQMGPLASNLGVTA